MLACLDESLRLYPPAPFLSQRLTPPGITEIAGCEVPGGVSSPVFSCPTSILELGAYMLFRCSCRWALESPALQPLAPPTASLNPTTSIQNAGLIPPSRIPSRRSSTMPAARSNHSLLVLARVWGGIWRTMRCVPFWQGFSGGLTSSYVRRAGIGSRARKRMWSGTSPL